MNKRVLILILTCTVILVLMAFFGTYIAFQGVAPNIVLIVLVFFSIKNGSFNSMIGAAVIGVVQDFMGNTPFGFYVILYVTIAYLFGKGRNKVFLDPLFLPMFLTAGGTILFILSNLFLNFLFTINIGYIEFFTNSTLISLIYHSVLAPILFKILDSVPGFKPPRRDME